jgi:hypothetical protein
MRFFVIERTSAHPFELQSTGKATEISIGLIEFPAILTTTKLWKAAIRRAV